jgi:hypothetical protein
MQDEVHRFAINYHRDLRSKSLTSSIIDNIEGLGHVRKNAVSIAPPSYLLNNRDPKVPSEVLSHVYSNWPDAEIYCFNCREFNDDFDFDVEMDDNFTFDTDSMNSSNSSQNFSVAFDPSVQEVNLEIGGGAAEFFLSEASSSDVFSADTKLFKNKFNLEDEKKGTTQDISFKMSSKNGSDNFHIGKGMNNDVNLKLSKAPIWNLDLGIGAGELKFDLSDYKVKDIKMETGAADISLKMGNKLKESKVRIESGVAKVKILVPQNAACQIKMDGALNTKDFDGFSKSSSRTWKTENFETASNKIYLEINSGLSAVSVDRY